MSESLDTLHSRPGGGGGADDRAWVTMPAGVDLPLNASYPGCILTTLCDYDIFFHSFYKYSVNSGDTPGKIVVKNVIAKFMWILDVQVIFSYLYSPCVFLNEGAPVEASKWIEIDTFLHQAAA